MGQLHLVINLDKKQALNPLTFGEGYKVFEFGCDGRGLMTALAVLLAAQCGGGGGDISSDSPLVGSWAGDRIVIAGNLASPNSAQGWCEDHDCPLYYCVERNDRYATGKEDINDISAAMIDFLCSEGPSDVRDSIDARIREDFLEQARNHTSRMLQILSRTLNLSDARKWTIPPTY